MLDMANHTTSRFLESKVVYTSSGGLELNAPSSTIRSSYLSSELYPNRGLRKGDEVFITYGSHSNSSLFSEYGFVLPRDIGQNSSSDHRGNQYNEVKIDSEIEELLYSMNTHHEKDEPSLEGERKKIMLEETGYWGDFTLHYKTPSHRVVVALRLMAINSSTEDLGRGSNQNEAGNVNGKGLRSSKRQKVRKANEETPSSSSQQDFALDKWNQTLLGLRDRISDENEARARELLLGICHKVEEKNRAKQLKYQEATRWLDRVREDSETRHSGEKAQILKDWEESIRMVEQVLDEELEIVKSVELNLGDDW